MSKTDTDFDDLQTDLMKRHLSSNFGSIEMFMEDPDEIK